MGTHPASYRFRRVVAGRLRNLTALGVGAIALVVLAVANGSCLGNPPFWDDILGLHAQESLEQGYLAGPYHPAFRELCEGRIYLKKALLQIDQFPEKTPLTIYVNPRELSKMAGQSRCNLNYLKQRNPIKIKPDDSLEAFCVRVESV